eukprot:GHVT01078730.1.p1 GENE.GHVT01078730.1~~GHVT01078730.1.p1  ORF type:complete len:178 (-),score=38.85 GHVT01078730.1:406-939(-)
MENAPFTTPPFPSPSASDPVTKLQIGINNTFYLVTDAVVEMTERAPPCDVSGRITPSSESLPSSEFTEEQLKEWVAKLSDDVGLLLEMTGDEVDKLPTSTRSKEQLAAEVQRLHRLNEEAADELIQCQRDVAGLYEMVRDSMRNIVTRTQAENTKMSRQQDGDWNLEDDDEDTGGEE